MPTGAVSAHDQLDSNSHLTHRNKPLIKTSNLLYNSTPNNTGNNSSSNNKTPSGTKQPFGGFSFESESLPDFSEFEGNTSGSESHHSHQPEKSSSGDLSGQHKRDGQKPTGPAKMAPVTTIETVTISRPLKVIAFLCGLFACILLIIGLASSEWLITDGYRQGLFAYCVSKGMNGTIPKVPFLKDQNSELAGLGCHRIDLNVQAYTLVAAAFCVVSLLVNIFASLLTVLGLRCRDPNNKYKYYRIAVYVMAVALVSILVTLVVYPVCFAQIMGDSERLYWEFGWAYGVAWGASIFLFGGIILLLCDKESEEIYYKERTIVQYADNSSKN